MGEPRPTSRSAQIGPFRHRLVAAGDRRRARGQSLVEFALVLPLLLIVLLGVADFGRVFSAGITIEAAARNAAEVGAIERLRNKPETDPMTCDAACVDAYYADLHQKVAKVACAESRLQPNTSFVAADDPGTSPLNEERTCPAMPVVRVCVHDDFDPRCGQPIEGFANPPPAECEALAAAWSNASGAADASHSVEVRVCYRFTTLFNLHLSLPMDIGINLGDVWIQRERVFMVDCPPGDVSGC